MRNSKAPAHALAAVIVSVSPEQAAAWLAVAGLPFERARRRVFGEVSLLTRAAMPADFEAVDRYAQAMTSGHWRAGEESDPVFVQPWPGPGPRPPGGGVSGRHRLVAVLKVGRPVELLVSTCTAGAQP